MPTEECRLTVENRITRLEGKVDEVLRRLDEMNHHLEKKEDKYDERIDNVEDDVKDFKSRVKGGSLMLTAIIAVVQCFIYIGAIRPATATQPEPTGKASSQVTIRVDDGTKLNYKPPTPK